MRNESCKWFARRYPYSNSPSNSFKFRFIFLTEVMPFDAVITRLINRSTCVVKPCLFAWAQWKIWPAYSNASDVEPSLIGQNTPPKHSDAVAAHTAASACIEFAISARCGKRYRFLRSWRLKQNSDSSASISAISQDACVVFRPSADDRA